MYSQYGEDDVIMDYFGEHTGRLLDVGAADGKAFSNSRALLERGWTGVLVEADPNNLKQLREFHLGNDNAVIAPVALTEKDGLLTFYTAESDTIHKLSARVLSTTQPSHVNKWSAAHRVLFKPIQVYGLSIASLLKQYPPPFDFLSIDVEGESVPRLLEMPLDVMGVRCVCVEHDGRQSEAINYCTRFGLTMVIAVNSINVVMFKP